MAPADTGLFPEELVFNIFLKTRLLQLGAPAAGEAELLPTAAFHRLRGNLACLASPRLLLPCLASRSLALPCLALPCLVLPCLALLCLPFFPSLGKVRLSLHPAPRGAMVEVAMVLLSEGTRSISPKGSFSFIFVDDLQNFSLL